MGVQGPDPHGPPGKLFLTGSFHKDEQGRSSILQALTPLNPQRDFCILKPGWGLPVRGPPVRESALRHPWVAQGFAGVPGCQAPEMVMRGHALIWVAEAERCDEWTDGSCLGAQQSPTNSVAQNSPVRPLTVSEVRVQAQLRWLSAQGVARL